MFGADEDEVSVMEGDSVTLNPGLTQIKTINLIEWRFGDPVIAHTDGNEISYPSHTGSDWISDHQEHESQTRWTL